MPGRGDAARGRVVAQANCWEANRFLPQGCQEVFDRFPFVGSGHFDLPHEIAGDVPEVPGSGAPRSLPWIDTLPVSWQQVTLTGFNHGVNQIL